MAAVLAGRTGAGAEEADALDVFVEFHKSGGSFGVAASFLKKGGVFLAHFNESLH